MGRLKQWIKVKGRVFSWLILKDKATRGSKWLIFKWVNHQISHFRKYGLFEFKMSTQFWQPKKDFFPNRSHQ